MEKGLTMEARKIWYSIIELYDNNLEMEPLVGVAQDRLAGSEPADSAKQQPPADSP